MLLVGLIDLLESGAKRTVQACLLNTMADVALIATPVALESSVSTLFSTLAASPATSGIVAAAFAKVVSL